MIHLVLIVFSLSRPPDMRCQSTIFGLGTKWDGGDALYLKRPINSSDIGIAHRTWPLGSWVLVENERTKRTAIARVIDRGPYGATHDGSWFVPSKEKRNPRRLRERRLQGKRPLDRGRFRGCADLTPRLAKILGHDGRDPVSLWRM